MTREALAEHVREVFADELAEIRDETLRRKTVNVWVRSMELSGATDLRREQPMNLDLEGPGVGLEHVRAVVRIALAMADAVAIAHGANINRDFVAVGALLHDVGKILEEAPATRHAMAGPLLAHNVTGTEMAAEEGLPGEVLHIIAYHSFDGQRRRRTPEGEIVYHADVTSVDTLYRRLVGISRSERTPSVYLPRMPIQRRS